MIGLIKAGNAAQGVRALSTAARGFDRSVPPRSPMQSALEDAQREIVRLQAERADHLATARRERDAAYETGMADGHSTAEDETAQRVERLDAALRTARADWDERLADLDALAVDLSRTALAKLFADSTDLGDLVARALSLKVAAIRADSVVLIAVSSRDFSGQADLDALHDLVGDARCPIRVDETLNAGACRIDLQLGHIDLGVATLAEEIDAALAGLVTESRGA